MKDSLIVSPDGKSLTLETQRITASKDGANKTRAKNDKIANEVSGMGILGELKRPNTDMDAIKRMIEKMEMEM